MLLDKAFLLFIFFHYTYCASCLSSDSFVTGSGNGELGCDYYINDIAVSWTITLPVERGEYIVLLFDNFNLFSGDFLTIYDGVDETGDFLGEFSGNVTPGPFQSSGESLFILFTSDNETPAGNFHAHWNSYSLSLKPDRCEYSNGEEVLVDSQGTMGCGGYSTNLVSSWIIIGNTGERLVLEFSLFDIIRDEDFLVIYDGHNSYSQLVANYTGSAVYPALSLSSNYAYIVFTSGDEENTGNGFTISWTSFSDAVDPCFNSTSSIRLENQGYIGCMYGYGNNVRSTWLIDIIGLEIIELDILTISLENNHDYLSVYDGRTESAPLIGAYTGTRTPGTILSSGNKLFITLTSDNEETGNGFTLTYLTAHKLQNEGCISSGVAVLTEREDNFGCNGYLDGVTEEWILVANENEVISLHWNSFDTEYNADFVYVYDGNGTDSSTLIYRAAGNSIPEPVISSQKFLTVQFIADSNTLVGSGFEGHYQSIPIPDENMCVGSSSQILTDSEGSFGCPGYTNGVSSWEISVEDNFRIYLDFVEFDINQRYDSLTIYDGPDDSSTILGTFTGTSIPPPFLSTSNFMYIVFNANSNTGVGFQAEYATIFTSIASGCYSNSQYTIEDNSGSIGCSGYSGNVDVTWSIITESGSTIMLEFTQFDTESPSDVVFVYDSSSADKNSLIGTYSGHIIPDRIESSSNNLFIEFTSDRSVEYTGFEATFNYVPALTVLKYCPSNSAVTLNQPSDVFGCNGYYDKIDVSWHISLQQNTRIELSFDSFDTELYYDVLEVFDGPDSDSTLVGSYSGNTLPPPFTSTSNNLYLNFVSDTSVSDYAGFVIRYTSFTVESYSTCISDTTYTLPNESGTFGCSGYSNNVDIVWQLSSYGNIIVTFDEFETEPGYDYVTVYDGTTNTSDILGIFSGTSASTVQSSGTNLLITFHSDESIHYSGFTASYITVDI